MFFLLFVFGVPPSLDQLGGLRFAPTNPIVASTIDHLDKVFSTLVKVVFFLPPLQLKGSPFARTARGSPLRSDKYPFGAHVPSLPPCQGVLYRRF